jgi:hypothetical protein
MEEERVEGVLRMENLIKNNVGARRFQVGYPEYFDKANEGRAFEFHEGKFLGWSDKVEYDHRLKSVTVFEL